MTVEVFARSKCRCVLALATMSLIGRGVLAADQITTSSASDQLTEVIVTAQKREEKLQDVPVSLTVLNTTTLAENNLLRIQDYYTQVPGLSIAPTVQSSQLISIRGITTGAEGSSTVGILIDDVPFGGTGSTTVPDIDPSDLARIEVLRGPQGTLYGASSLGGLLKFVTIDPSTDALSGRVEAGTDSVYNGYSLGYNFRGAVNVPLSDTLAFRASVFTREDPGYINDPISQRDGINQDHADGGHVAVLWLPNDAFSLKLSALYQVIRGEGTNEIDTSNNASVTGYRGPPLGPLEQDYVRGAGAYDREAQAYSAVLKGNIAGLQLTSITGFNVNSYHDSFDETQSFGFGVYQSKIPSLPAEVGAPFFDNSRTTKVTQELRISSAIGKYIDWFVGGFYTHESTQFVETFPATNLANGEIIAPLGFASFPSDYTEYAGFADLTYHITEQFDVQVGGRESTIKNAILNSVYSGLLLGNSVTPGLEGTVHAFTYLVTPEYKFSPDFMVYGRVASGYRPGGANPAGFPGVPPLYQPDKTTDFEIGSKGSFFDRMLAVEGAVYYIDWRNIQLPLTAQVVVDGQTVGEGYIGNAGGAKSQGVELSFDLRPITGLKISGWTDFGDAVLTRDFPLSSNIFGKVGAPLPYSARFSSNLSGNQEFPIWTSWKGYVGASMSYIGRRQDVFGTIAYPAQPQRQELPAYAKTDLQAGIKDDSWVVNLYANNVTNREGVISGGLNNSFPWGFYYIQPRTVGASVSKRF
jgi:iron complex outermembrane receptor protein